jgi:RNA-directed DNA polymerase
VLPGLCYRNTMSSSKRRKRPSDWPEWFEARRYLHFDRPIRNPEQARKIVESPTEVARHAFLPFIHFQKIARKYKRHVGGEVGGFVKKPRPLSYASHLDSLIFRRYCLLLSDSYERMLAEQGLGDSVLAYRRFNPPKCNIHFANEAFCFVKDHTPCVAMTFDVKDFFESLDHKRLKQQWKQVFGTCELHKDHYAVFRAVTRYSWVEREPLFKLFGITKKKQKQWKGPICTPEEFRSKVRSENHTGLIQVKTDGKGIPQGSPISALLSNIYMLSLDARMAPLVKAHGGLYFRYSDDILLVCPSDKKVELETQLRKEMDSVGLALHDGPGKSTVATFSSEEGGILNCDRPLQYLGFTFDGKYVRVRSQTIVRYMRRMKEAVSREKHIAERRVATGGEPGARRKLLYSRYTHLGTHNFISYANKSTHVFMVNKIREQIKRHWPDLHALLKLK